MLIIKIVISVFQRPMCMYYFFHNNLVRYVDNIDIFKIFNNRIIILQIKVFKKNGSNLKLYQNLIVFKTNFTLKSISVVNIIRTANINNEVNYT